MYKRMNIGYYIMCREGVQTKHLDPKGNFKKKRKKQLTKWGWGSILTKLLLRSGRPEDRMKKNLKKVLDKRVSV